MAIRPLNALVAALVVVALALVGYWYYLATQEPDPQPFHMTVLVSGTEANATDENATDVQLWIAVAVGEPKPPWADVEVTLESAEGCQTLVPPRLRIDDQDGNGRVTEGDLLLLYSLDPVEAQGEVTLWNGERAIGKVEL